jgi:hypothetical protein
VEDNEMQDDCSVMFVAAYTKPLGQINALGVVDGFLKIECFCCILLL